MCYFEDYYNYDYDLEQKEFNIASEIYHSGFKRVGKKYIGRARRAASDKLVKMQRNQIAGNIKANRKMDELAKQTASNKVLGRKLAKEANKRGIRVFDNDLAAKNSPEVSKGSKIVELNKKRKKEIIDEMKYDEMLEGGISRDEKKVRNALINNKAVINLENSYDKNWDVLSHEIGHDMNKDGRISGAIRKLTDFKHKKYKGKSKVGSIMNSAKNKLGISLKNTQIPEYLEERNAWKNARKLMKRNGATKTQLEHFDKTREAALKTYKTKIIGTKIKNLGEKIPIPSNRTISPFRNYNVTSKTRRREQQNIARNFRKRTGRFMGE